MLRIARRSPDGHGNKLGDACKGLQARGKGMQARGGQSSPRKLQKPALVSPNGHLYVSPGVRHGYSFKDTNAKCGSAMSKARE